MGLGRNRGGKENRIDGDPRAICRLPEADAPGQETIFGRGRLDWGGLG